VTMRRLSLAPLKTWRMDAGTASARVYVIWMNMYVPKRQCCRFLAAAARYLDNLLPCDALQALSAGAHVRY